VLAAGIEFGGTKCLGVVIEPDGKVIREYQIKTPYAAEDLIAGLVEIADKLAPFDSIGIGAAGLVSRRGVLTFAPNVGHIQGLDIRSRMTHELDRPVAVDNDAACAALAEWRFGAARGERDVALVALGTGIGAAFIAHGDLQRGAHGFAGEPGHMVVDPNGPVCVCGQRGCWERYASGAGLSYLGGGLPSEEVERLARAGDPMALEALEKFAWWLALGLVNLGNILDPDLFVIGGGLVRAADLYLDRTRELVHELRYADSVRPPFRIEPATLGHRAGAIGAALLAH
jgi:glucokinase